MKYSMLLFGLLLFYSAAIAHGNKGKNFGNPIAAFVNNDTVYDFGGIPQGESVENQFEIKNTGNAPLVITSVKCDSGKVNCEWPHKSIKPGKTGTMTIAYSACGAVGSFLNNIVIISNSTEDRNLSLQIKGAVVPGRSHYAAPPKLNKKHNHNETCVGCYVWPPVSH